MSADSIEKIADEMRTCIICKRTLTLDHYYKRSDGRKYNHCKTCKNAISEQTRADPSVRASRNKRRRDNRHSTGLPARDRRHAAKREGLYPEKAAAKKALNWAVASGQIVKPQTCEACGQVPRQRQDGGSGLQGHHDDYSKPLDVRWLCIGCHVAHHQKEQTV